MLVFIGSCMEKDSPRSPGAAALGTGDRGRPFIGDATNINKMNDVARAAGSTIGPPVRCLLTAVAVCVTAVLTAVAVHGAELELRAECRPKGAVVTLGDVADVVTNNPREAEVLGAVELFPAPPPGERRRVRLREIQDLLLLRGVNLVEHRFSGSAKVAVLAGTELHDAADDRSAAIAAAKKTEREAAERASLPETVVVAARSLSRAAVISAADVRLEQRMAGEAQRGEYHSIEQVLGQQTTRAIDAGRALTAASVRPSVLVRRGEVVSVFARSPGIRVRSVARARDEGSLGDLIAVESFEGRKTFLARVSGIQEVEVYARAMRSAPAASDFSRTPGVNKSE